MPNQSIYKLTDVDVHTVGLVSLGANNETFFLLKSRQEESDMPNDKTVLETTAEVVGDTQEEQVDAGLTKSVGDTIRSVLTEFFSKRKEEESLMEDKEKQDVQEEQVVAEVPTEENEQEVTKAAEVAEKLVALQKANEALLERVEKAEAAAAAEREAREKREWIEKAEEYAAVPTETDALAEQLHFLHKADPKRAEFWMETLKAIDAQLREAGLFAEVGTSKAKVEKGSVDALAEVIKTGDVDQLREAYLELGAKKGYDYLEERRVTRKVR